MRRGDCSNCLCILITQSPVLSMQSAPDARLGAFAGSSRAISRASRPSPVVAHASMQAANRQHNVLGNPTAAWPLISKDTAACSSLLCMASNDADNEVPFDSRVASTEPLTVLAPAVSVCP